jgi:predicted nucleic acid-binding protein
MPTWTKAGANGSERPSTVYVDTSALGRILLGEADRPVIEAALRGFDRAVASRLLRVELRRVGYRDSLQNQADDLLAGIDLIPLDDEVLAAAESIAPPRVTTLDAIHLVTAVRLFEADELDAIMTYDLRLAEGAREHGLPVLAPS